MPCKSTLSLPLFLLLTAILTGGCAYHAPMAPTVAAASPAPTAVAPYVGPLTLGLSGQSNAVFLQPYLQQVDTVIGYSESSLPIRYWDAPDGYMWTKLLPTLHEPLRAFVWWQGESDRDAAPGAYAAKLADLLGRVRQAANQPTLLIAVVELGPNCYDSPPWREGRAWAESDAHALFIATEDLPYVDAVHMTDAGYGQIAQRIDRQIRERLGR